MDSNIYHDSAFFHIFSPHCGNEMIEGHLICEKCGEEIRIVPDFEPEIENSITAQLFISMAIVIGPTPPGTGVIALHTGATSS